MRYSHLNKICLSIVFTVGCSAPKTIKKTEYFPQLIDFSEVLEWPKYNLEDEKIRQMVNKLNLLGKKPKSYSDADYEAESQFRKMAFPTKRLISTTSICPLVYYTAGHDFDYYFYITCGIEQKNYHVLDATGQLIITRSELSKYASEETFSYKEHLGFYTHPQRYNSVLKNFKRGDKLNATFVMLPGKDDTYWMGLLSVEKMR